jgi:uncharacterized protein (DUF58 family)
MKIFLIFTISLLSLASMFTLQGEFALLALIPAGFLLVAEYQRANHRIPQVERHLELRKILTNEKVKVSIRVTNHSSKQFFGIIEDILPQGLKIVGGSSKKVLRIEAGAEESFEYEVQGSRGAYVFDRIELETSDYFAFFPVKESFSRKMELIIYLPRATKLELPALPRASLIYSGQNPAGIGGQGNEFFDVRPYRQGDDTRHLNWRLSARTGKPFVNLFQEERVADIGLIVDCRAKVYGYTREWESVIYAAQALAGASLARGDRVGVLFYGGPIKLVYPGFGKKHLEKIRVELSKAKVDNHQVFENLNAIPFRAFPPKSQMFFISPLGPKDIDPMRRIKSHAYGLRVFSPDRLNDFSDMPVGKIAKRLQKIEQEAIRRSIRHLGIPVFTWNIEEAFESQIMTQSREAMWAKTF